ncbi:MAG: Fe-S cluster assembly protein SufB, partial [Propionibacteriaceae bacterium]|nr:Fe-S cluster assembly protein SufB [Propionibacteriaceae bacterium]
MTTQIDGLEELGSYKYGWSDPDIAGATAQRGLNEAVVRGISHIKDEPAWMLERRLRALEIFDQKPLPTWGPDLSDIDFDAIKYYVRPVDRVATSWDALPEDIKRTYDRLGLPEAEQARLVAGIAAQYESEVVYHKINEELER